MEGVNNQNYADSPIKDRKFMKQLVDSVWPKDPLNERRKMQFGKEKAEATDLLDNVSHD